MKYLVCLVMAVASCGSLGAQTLAEQVDANTRLIQSLGKKVDSLAAQLDRVETKLDALKAPKAEPKTAWAPSDPAVTRCKCGCVLTGQCTCKDCDHPQTSAPKTVVQPTAAPTTYYTYPTQTYEAPTTYYAAPAASGGCANGQCGGTTRGIFRRFR